MFLRTILSVPAFIANAILELAVHMVASFLAMVLNHPAVMNAGASTIVAGMKQLCLEEDLDVHAQALSETLTKHMERDALRAGKDFPKLWSQFIKGVMAGDDKEVEADKKEEKKQQIRYKKETKKEHHGSDSTHPIIKGSHSGDCSSIEVPSRHESDASVERVEHRKTLGDFFKGVLSSSNDLNLDDEELTNGDGDDDNKDSDFVVDAETKMKELKGKEDDDHDILNEHKQHHEQQQQQQQKGLGQFFFKGVLGKSSNTDEDKEDNEEQTVEDKVHIIMLEDSTSKEGKISNIPDAKPAQVGSRHDEQPKGLEQFFKGVMGTSKKDVAASDNQLHDLEDKVAEPKLET